MINELERWEDPTGEWRTEQERETAASNNGNSALSEPGALDRFLHHFQRLTQHSLRVSPASAEIFVTIDDANTHRLK